MNGFFALLRLQLLSRYGDLKPKNIMNQLREKRGKTIGMALLILFLIIYLGGMLFFLEMKLLDVLMQMGMPEMLISLAILLSMAGTLIMSFFFTLSSVYLGRDGAVLAALPLKSRTILSAKLTQVWISETCIAAVLILPASILYGTRVGVDAGFWFRMVAVWLLISVIPICLISFVSSLLVRISALWKHREIIMTVGGIVLMIAYMFLMMNLGSFSGNDENQGEILRNLISSNQGRIEMITRAFPPATWAGKGLLGNGGMLALFAGVSVALAVLTVWLLGYSYRTLSLLSAETPAATAKKLTGKEKYSKGSAFLACVKREFLMILRVPSYATNILPISIMPLLMVVMFMVIFRRNTEGTGQGIAEMLEKLNPAIIMGILTAAVAYMGGMNSCLSTAVTREGKGHDILVSLPIPAKTLIDAKFVVGFGLSMMGILAAYIAIIVMAPKLILEAVLAFILCALFSYVNSVLALTRDIRKPRLDWVTEQEAVKQNFGVLISMLLSWAILVVLAVLTYFLITWGLGMVPVFAILAAILLGLAVFFTARMRKVTEQYYCAG